MGAVCGSGRQLLIAAVGLLHQHHAGHIIVACHGEGVLSVQLPASRGSGDDNGRRIRGGTGLEAGHTVHGGTVRRAVADLNVRLGLSQRHCLGGQRVVAHIGTIGINGLNLALVVGTIRHHIGHVAFQPVGQLCHDLAAGDLNFASVHIYAFGSFRHHQLLDRAGQGNQVAAVVLEVQCAVLIHHGAADAVLRQGALRLEHHGCAVALTVFGDAVLQSCLTRAVVDHAHDTGGVVIHEVDVHAAILGVGGQQAAGLGIALRGGGVGHVPAGQIQHRDVVAAVRGELTGTGHAHIGSAIVHHGGGGAHAAQIDGLGAGEFAVIAKDLAVEVAALGGEVHAAVRVSDVGADIAGVAFLGVHDLAGALVEHHQLGGLGGIAALAVVGADDHILVIGVSARPVEAALTGIAPQGLLGGGALIVRRQAHEVGGTALAVPEAHIHIPVRVGDGGVGLALQRILIDPQGRQIIGAERLHAALLQRHEDHTVGIGGRDDGEVGVADHVGGGHGLAGGGIQLQQSAARVGVHVAAHEDGGAHRVAAIAAAAGAGPQQLHIGGLGLRVDLAGGGLDAGDGHVLVIAAEVGPESIILRQGERRCGGQRHVQHALIQRGLADGAGLGDVTLGHHNVAVALVGA